MLSVRPNKFIRPIQILTYPSLSRLIPVFDHLKPDQYLQDLLNEEKPTRHRLFRTLNVNPKTHNVTLTNNNILQQKVDDFRNKERKFSLLPDSVIEECQFQNLLKEVLKYTIFYDTDKVKNIICNTHFVRQIAYPGTTATNAPEGRHQDGADFIMSAFIVNLENANGGVSKVGEECGFNYLEKQLQPGEGLIHDDNQYHHDITRISSKDGINNAIRDLIGFDFILEK